MNYGTLCSWSNGCCFIFVAILLNDINAQCDCDITHVNQINTEFLVELSRCVWISVHIVYHAIDTPVKCSIYIILYVAYYMDD